MVCSRLADCATVPTVQPHSHPQCTACERAACHSAQPLAERETSEVLAVWGRLRAGRLPLRELTPGSQTAGHGGAASNTVRNRPAAPAWGYTAPVSAALPTRGTAGLPRVTDPRRWGWLLLTTNDVSVLPVSPVPAAYRPPSPWLAFPDWAAGGLRTCTCLFGTAGIFSVLVACLVTSYKSIVYKSRNFKF